MSAAHRTRAPEPVGDRSATIRYRRVAGGIAMMESVNDHQLVSRVVGDLAAAGIEPLIFGGWAKELLGLEPVREHTDIDLLVVASQGRVDDFIATRDEVRGKRFAHKRAFIEDDVLVELFLVDPAGGSTLFWEEFEVVWPSLEPVIVSGLPVAPEATITHYDRKHDAIRASRP